jgi:hypothetical protein
MRDQGLVKSGFFANPSPPVPNPGASTPCGAVREKLVWRRKNLHIQSYRGSGPQKIFSNCEKYLSFRLTTVLHVIKYKTSGGFHVF